MHINRLSLIRILVFGCAFVGAADACWAKAAAKAVARRAPAQVPMSPQPPAGAGPQPVGAVGGSMGAGGAGGGAVEVRGQSRALSMMLVMKNGKEGINFIKVRKDYSAEIKRTSY